MEHGIDAQMSGASEVSQVIEGLKHAKEELQQNMAEHIQQVQSHMEMLMAHYKMRAEEQLAVMLGELDDKLSVLQELEGVAKQVEATEQEAEQVYG